MPDFRSLKSWLWGAVTPQATPVPPDDSLHSLLERLAREPGLYPLALRTLAEADFYDPFSDDLRNAERLLLEQTPQAAARLLASPNLLLSPRAHQMRSQPYYQKALLSGIRASGDGSRARPYLVARREDCYDLLETLDLVRVSQELESDRGRWLDVIHCSGGTEVCFDVSIPIRHREERGEALRLRRDYWCANPAELARLRAGEASLSWLQNLRLLQLACLELASGGDQELCARLGARLLSATSPFRACSLQVDEQQKLTRNVSLTHLGSLELLRLENGVPRALAFVPWGAIRRLELGERHGPLRSAEILTWAGEHEAVKIPLGYPDLPGVPPLCLPNARHPVPLGSGPQLLWLEDAQGGKTVDLAEVHAIDCPQGNAGPLQEWEIEPEARSQPAPPPPPPPPPPEPQPVVVAAPRRPEGRPGMSDEWLVMVPSLEARQIPELAQTVASATGKPLYDVAHGLRTNPAGVVLENLSRRAAEELKAGLDRAGHPAVLVAMRQRPVPRSLLVHSLDYREEGLQVNEAEVFPWSSLVLLVGGTLEQTSTELKAAAPTLRPRSPLQTLAGAGTPSMEQKVTSETRLLVDIYSQLPDEWVRLRLEARKLTYRHLGSRMQTGYRLNFPLVLQDLEARAPLLAGAELNALLAGHPRPLVALAELESRGVGALLQRL